MTELFFFFFFFTRGGCSSCLRACLGARLLPQSYQYPNLSEGADRVGGQLRGVTMIWQSLEEGAGKRCSECVPYLVSYTIGSRKLSANEQFFIGAQTVVSLLQTTQIKQGMSFIAANKVYTSTNKTTIPESRPAELFFLFLPGVDASCVYVRALALG